MRPPTVLVDVQLALAEDTQHPSAEQLSIWAELAVLGQIEKACEITIRLVHSAEISQLNERYRGKSGSTNVLSFPLDPLDPLEESNEMLAEILSHRPLGDVVICHDVVVQEAKSQGKKLHHHYAHMVTHGILHLCGYDHVDEQEAIQMEALEVEVLARSEIANPYT